MRATHSVLSLIFLGALGCTAETFGGHDLAIDPAEFEVVGGTPIAGGTITVSAPWMAELPEEITVTIGDTAIATAERADGSSDQFLLHLPPSLPAGSHELFLARSSTERELIGRVRTGGFSEIREAGSGGFLGRIQALDSRPTLVGSSGPSEALTTLDLRTATLRTFPEALTGSFYGIGSAPEPNQFILQGSSDLHFRGGIGVTGWVVDSLPLPWQTERVADLGGDFQLAQANAISYLARYSPETGFARTYLADYSSSDRVAYSPDGRWSVPDHSRSANGVLVFDRSDASVRWIAGWERARTLFTPDGTLLVYGGHWLDPTTRRLARIDVASGTELTSVPTDLDRVWLDMPSLVDGGSLLAIATLQNGAYEVRFFDPTTLAEVARSRSSDLENPCRDGDETWVVDDPTMHLFYVVSPYCGGTTGTVIGIFRFPE